MSRESLPCPPQMRNGGSLPAHLSSSFAAILGPRRWLAPPKCTPALGAPDCTSYEATYTLTQYNTVIVDRAINILQVHLSQATKNAERAHRVETARSAALAKWRRQEDVALAKALAKEAEMQRRHDVDLHTITNGFMIDLESLGIMVHSYGRDDVSAMLEMKWLEDVATVRHFHEPHRTGPVAGKRTCDRTGRVATLGGCSAHPGVHLCGCHDKSLGGRHLEGPALL
jgi:hypothetical protein